MSRPPTLTLPDCARALRLDTDRGEFAGHLAEPVGAPRGTALLLPGFTGSKEDFIGMLAPLAGAGFRVLALDGRGQYQSGGPREPAAYLLPELARDALAQARAIGAGPVHLLGHSFGGLVARAAAIRDATAFRSLTLLSSGPGAVAEEQRERVTLLLSALGRWDMETVWRAMRALDPPEAATDVASSAVREFLRERWCATVPDQLITTGRQLIEEPDRVAELAAVPLPKLVLSGETDYAWPVPQMDDMATRLGAERVRIAGSDHSPNADLPELTAAHLATFWQAAPAEERSARPAR